MERHRARAEADLVAVVGGASLCRVGNGPQASSAKYAEGRYSALRELGHLRGASGSLALAAAVELLDVWETAQARAVTQGPLWAAYREGGVTELRSLVDDLTTATDGAR